jgi:hypothetical protein
LAMMVAAIALPEGLVCLIFAFPLVSCIALIVGGSVDRARAKEKRKGPTLMFVGIPLLVLSLEGVVGSPFASADHVRSSITVAMSPSAVAAALAAPPRFDRKMPRFLRFGFNRPIASTGGGIRVGDHRVVEFVGGTHDDHPLHLFGFTGHSGTRHHATMALRVVRSANDEVVYAIEQDNTMLARWVALRTATVHWTPLGPERTKVTWSFDYDRLISPAFYFAPLQRYGMTEAARYLLLSTVARR